MEVESSVCAFRLLGRVIKLIRDTLHKILLTEILRLMNEI